jgi:hypothetical protein
MRRHHVRGLASCLLWSCAIFALTALSAFSQTLGQVTGRITDASGAAVVAASVTLLNTATNAVRNTVSTEDGDYTFPSVPPGIYNVKAERPGFRVAAANHLELAVEGVPVGGRVARGAGAGRGMFAGTGSPVPPQEVAEVSTHWPTGKVDVRIANYLGQAQQKWMISAVRDAGGYPGSPYFKITVAGTGRTLAATADAELVVLPAFTGAPEQLWRIEQFPDGTWRIMPKSAANSKQALALSAVGGSFATLARLDAGSEKQRWLINMP